MATAAMGLLTSTLRLTECRRLLSGSYSYMARCCLRVADEAHGFQLEQDAVGGFVRGHFAGVDVLARFYLKT